MEPTIAVAHRVAENASDLRNPFNVCPLKRGSIHMTLVQYDATTEHTERSFRAVPLRAVSLFGAQLLGEAWPIPLGSIAPDDSMWDCAGGSDFIRFLHEVGFNRNGSGSVA